MYRKCECGGTVYKRGTACTKCEDPRPIPLTPEEEAEEKEIREMMNQSVQARVLIIEQTGGKRNVAGEIDCVRCKTGKLKYSVAYNGHVWANCTTEECLSWME